MPQSINDILTEREATHGDFAVTADLAQEIKTIYKKALAQGATLTAIQREALDMFASKIARILSGNPNEPEHWRDIAGYAALAQRELENQLPCDL